MKKKLLFMLLLVLCFILTACQNKEDDLSEVSEPIEVIEVIEESKVFSDEILSKYINTQLVKCEVKTINYNYKLYSELSDDYPYAGRASGLSGVVETKIFDFDSDGSSEALVLYFDDSATSENGNIENTLYAQMYEYENNQVILKDQYPIMSGIFEIADVEEGFLFIKDNKYICAYHNGQGSICIDGINISIEILSYENNVFNRYVSKTVEGSDFEGMEDQWNEFASQLRVVGLINSANITMEKQMYGLTYSEENSELLFKMYTDNSNTNADLQEYYTTKDLNSLQSIAGYLCNKEDLLNQITETKKEVIIDSTDFRKVLESQSQEEILMYNEADFDGDGNLEAFAFLGSENSDEGTYNGELWFVNTNGAKLLEPLNCYWNVDKTYNINNKKYIVLSQYVGTGDISYIWTVTDGEAKEANISKEVSGFSANETITVIQDRYDLDSTGSGHTWKPYYLFIDDDGEFREFGGVEISKEQLLKFDGASEIIARIESTGYQIKNVIYRQNGIININYVSSTSQKNSTLSYNENIVQEYETNDGIYDLAMLEAIAVYPSEINIPE